MRSGHPVDWTGVEWSPVLLLAIPPCATCRSTQSVRTERAQPLTHCHREGMRGETTNEARYSY